ncbi:MAG: ATP-binding protein [bacterium]|nr:ATP-binding protein [bacterium]
MRIRTKLLVFSLPLFLAAVVIMTLSSRQAVQTIMFQEVAKRGLTISAGLAQSSEIVSGFQSGSERMLLAALQSTLENTEAQYVFALDVSGRVLAHTNVAEKGKQYSDPVTLEVLRMEEPEYRRIETDGQFLMDVSFPVWSLAAEESGEEFLFLGEQDAGDKKRLGTLRLGLPLRNALETADQISGQVFWIVTIVIGTVLVVAMFFARKILRPVHLLAMAAHKVGHGGVGETVPVMSRDEIGDLARSFNQMSRDLADTTVSKDFLNSILEDMLDALIVTTADGLIRMVNRSAVELLGYPEEDLLNRSAALVFSDAEKIFGSGGVSGQMKENAILSREINLRTRDGKTVPALLSVAAFMNTQGRVEGFILTAKDITERKEAEEERKQLERQLVQSERLASVGTVVAGIVHNLKNPLTGIMGFAEILKMQYPEMTQVDRILSSSEQMQDMIENILAKSRQKKTVEKLDLNGLLERELDFMDADQAFKHKVEKEIRLSEKLPFVMGVYTDFSQVFGNLLRNAVEAMYDRPEKRLRVETRFNGGGEVIVEVEDTGSGIHKDHLEHLFAPFFTTKTGDGTEGKPQGTGLGLYTVRQLLEPYGANIEVESVVEQGTTFRVHIPAGKAEVGEAS